MAFTFFFRDAETLELAVAEALPDLRGRAFIHVWDAGCAHGPEPYTLAILLRERMSDFIFRNVRIHATDVDATFAERVRGGIFAAGEIQRVPPKIVDRYFRPAATPGFVEVVPELRAKIEFSVHDLLCGRPIREGLSMVVCKNVLLHFEEAQRIEVLRMFHTAMQPGGVLVMEHTQKLPPGLTPYFRQVAPHAQVYRKLDPVFAGHVAEPAASPHVHESAPHSKEHRVGAAVVLPPQL
jgi:chemotaxis protein methyltransferase CheR